MIKALKIAAAALILISAAGCSSEDGVPLYFPPPGDGGDDAPASPSESTDGRQCTVSFTSRLCVSIKGEKIEVGVEAGDELCAEVPTFPLHISGSGIAIKGSEFPDISVEGHGLPAPITMNARGNGDGADNVGEGTVDAAGNIKIDGFSLFIVALGMVGEVPNLTLTTGSTDELPSLPAAAGKAPDATGAMTLVTGTVVGHTIDAADPYFMGASLIATFTGSISPALSGCGDSGGERSIDVKRLYVSKDGSQTEAPLSGGERMEVSSGTYIADSPADVGERFETTAKFRIKNVGNNAQQISIPPRTGPFYMRSLDPLTRALSPGQSFVLDVTFRPDAQTSPGEAAIPIAFGIDQFTLVGRALEKSGRASVNTVDDEGQVTAPDVGEVPMGSAAVPANTERKFFLCKEISCGDAKAPSSCLPCSDPEKQPCELLPVSTSGRPLGEVDASCKEVEPGAAPLYTIDLKGSGEIELAGQKQVLAIRNRGVKPMNVTAVSVSEVGGSKSRGEFSIPKDAIFAAKSFSEIQSQVAAALDGKKSQGAALPVVLPPFQPGYDETTLYVVVTYKPSDLVGADGSVAGVGSKVTDKAVVKISTDKGDISTVVSGTTTIHESPPLELYFKTSVGVRQVADSGSFSFRGVTPETVDLAFPLFLRVADTATSTMRITSIQIEGQDAANFRLLDTAEKISKVQPPSGKGMRCSIPNIDPATGEMTGESFDLRPVSLEPPGFDLKPGAYSVETMPLFGCIDFHREAGGEAKRLFEAKIIVRAQEITAQGTPAKNPDGSYRQTTLSGRLLAAINPRSGMMVLRVTQTMAAILNPQFPGLSSISSLSDMMKESGGAAPKDEDLQLFTGAMILDPFDEMTIRSSDGADIVSTPGDGITAVFRTLDTSPVSENYADGFLFDYANLIHDGTRPEGSRGVFEDYPNVPPDARANGWRIFTSALSWPGPIGPPDKVPSYPSRCAVVNPCDPEELKLFTDAGAQAAGRGACAFFYASGGRYDSPAFHSADEMEGGTWDRLCNRVDKPQKLLDLNTGRYSVDGRLEFEELGFRFFGPTYFHNPGGPFGNRPPMDELFYVGFTTGVLKPPAGPDDINVLPDPKINLSKGEFKMNLTDKSGGNPPICSANTKNRVVGGKSYSTWKYLDGLLYKDDEASTPAGCPEDDNKFGGGQAFLRGKDLNQEDGSVTLVSAMKFGSSDDLSFAFKDVVMFIVVNGWLCDPNGDEADFEGKHCYDLKFNEHDARGQISIIE